MNRAQASTLIKQTFTQAFDKGQFRYFIVNLLNRLDEGKAFARNNQYIKDAFSAHVQRFERLGTYTSPDKEALDILIVHLTAESKLERARTTIRNFVADHLKIRDEKDAALVAFVSPTEKQWRFSYVKMEYATVKKESDQVGVETRLTPARRFSYIVGEGESCHTAQTRFLELLQDTSIDPVLADIEDAFSVEAVTKEFFNKYRELFEDFYKALDKLVAKDKALRDEFNAKEVKTVDFTKKLMGQIVFLYFLQKKGWLGVAKGQDWGTGPHDFLRKLASQSYGKYDNFFNDVLESLFYDTLATDRGHEAWCTRFKCRIPFLNGGLFEPLGDYGWKRTDILLPNILFTNSDYVEEGISGSGVLDVFDRYNFTVNEAEPLEKEVAIDPEMLGKVFENLIEENRRKGLGAYYTPREIVHYMCQESPINYLETVLNKDREIVPRAEIETFVHLGEQISHYEAVEAKYAVKMPKSIEKNARLKLADITVCDPAVGSGAFPVGMMTEIVRARCVLTPYFNDVHERTPYRFKHDAIQGSLYGVNIDPGAVEIAKLRLWLSLVVDEEETEQIKPLPNLDFKIVAGNSLIGFPFKSQGLQAIECLKARFFEETDHDRKAELKRKIDSRLGDCFASSKQSLGYEVNFDFEIHFSEVFQGKSGFDIVIANPPYLFITEIPPEERAYFFEQYSTVAYRFDIYGVFIEKSVTQLLPQGGTLTFITPHTLLSNDSFEKLRRLLLEQTHLKKVIDIGPGAFENARNEVMVFVACKKPPRDAEPVHVFTTSADAFPNPKKEFTIEQHLWSQNPKASWLINLAGRDSQILTKMERAQYRLGELCTINQGLRTGDNKTYLSADRKSGKWKPVVGGKDVGRYGPLPNGQYVYYEPSVIDAPRRPEIFESREKLVIQEIRNITLPRRLVATYDNRQFYCLQSTNVINHKIGVTQPSIKCLLGFLNSAAANFFFRCRFPGNNHIPSNQLAQIPIPAIPPVQHKPMERLVDRILAAKERDTKADVNSLEREIDQLVYALYALTPQEIQIVEGAAK